MRHAWISAAALTSLVLALPAAADWPAGGKAVGRAGDQVTGDKIIRFHELASGDLALVTVGVGGYFNQYFVQRISRGGDFAPGWTPDGVGVPETYGWYSSFWLQTAVDDSGCVWIAGPMYVSPSTDREGASLVRPDAIALPGSYAWATSAPASPEGVADVVPAPGGAYVVFGGVLIQRLTRSGSVAAGWPAAGLSTGITDQNYGFGELGAVPDGADGAVVFAPGAASGPTVQRIDAGAVRHTGWPSAGLMLSSDPADLRADPFAYFVDPLILSGADHFIAAWPRPRNQTLQQVKLQRFSADGTLDPAWPPGGVLAVATDALWGITVIPDGLGGAHVLWYTGNNQERGTHVLASGQFAPGLDSTGVLLPAPGSKPFVRTPAGRPFVPYVIADAAPNGGLVFAWPDTALSPTPSVRVRWLQSDYTADPSEPAEGRLILPSSFADLCGLHSDGIGGAFVAWVTYTDRGPSYPYLAQIQMTRLLPSSLVGVPPHSGRISTLAISAPRPNPARDAVALDLTLPDDSPARVELLDVSGRVRRSQLVVGAGPHSVAFDRLGSLPPGLYFARAAARAGARSVRVVVSR